MMAIDIRQIGTFGISFSRGLDQTWFNLWRKDYGFSMDLYQSVEDEDSDDDDELINTVKAISFEEGESMLSEIFERGHLEAWKPQYSKTDEGPETDLNWTIDVDDVSDQDMLLISGNWKLPSNGWMSEILRVIRKGEPTFARCFKDLG